jgi:hypothetical protein
MLDHLIDSLANSLPDLAILAFSAIVFGCVGGIIVFLSSRLWFRRWPQHSPFEDHLAEITHTSLLGFSAFVLALLISNGVSSLSKIQGVAIQEATSIYRLGRELDALGPARRDAKQALAAYARNVAEDEWPHLARLPNSLSPLAQQNLDDLWAGVRSAQRAMDSANPARSDLAGYVARIETLRGDRLSEATSNIPSDFWLLLLLFVVDASFFVGRETPRRFGMQINWIQMSAIGLAVGLVIVLNNPFRGQTSVSPEIIGRALSP